MALLAVLASECAALLIGYLCETSPGGPRFGVELLSLSMIRFAAVAVAEVQERLVYKTCTDSLSNLSPVT